MKTAQFSAQIDGVTAKKDRTLSVKLGTQEMQSEDSAFLLSLMEKQIWVAVSETPLTHEDLEIPEVIMEFKNDKSPSSRLRAVLFVYYTKHSESLGKSWEVW